MSVSPLTARTQADRDLVALVFAASSATGPDGTVVPDLAERWSVDATGKTWTVDLRDDARWQDGEPVTADDVVFTIHTLQDPAYSGPGGRRRGARSTVTALDARPRDVHPEHAARWLPPGADPADRPGPPARRRPGRGPGGSIRSGSSRSDPGRSRSPS